MSDIFGKNKERDKKGNTINIKVSWHIDDVLMQAKNNNVKLTRKQASGILDRMIADHDATIGINWDVIDYYIMELKHNRR